MTFARTKKRSKDTVQTSKNAENVYQVLGSTYFFGKREGTVQGASRRELRLGTLQIVRSGRSTTMVVEVDQTTVRWVCHVALAVIYLILAYHG